jgi:hypothetical protein
MTAKRRGGGIGGDVADGLGGVPALGTALTLIFLWKRQGWCTRSLGNDVACQLGMEGVEIFKKPDSSNVGIAVSHAKKDSRNSARAALIRRSWNGGRLDSECYQECS